MGHSSEKRWGEVGGEVGRVCAEIVNTINQGEEKYLQLVEVFTYAGGTDAGFAALLFEDHIEARNDGNGPTAEEIAKAADVRAAMVAVHELWQAANNVAVAAAQRAQFMRRMI